MPKCKLTTKTHHSCSFKPIDDCKTDVGHQLLVSLGHQLCRLSGKFLENILL